MHAPLTRTDTDRPTLLSTVPRAASKLDVIFATTCWSREWGLAFIEMLDAFRIEFDDGFVLNEDGADSLTSLECATLASYVVRQPSKSSSEWLALYVSACCLPEARREMAFDLADFARHHSSVRRIGARRRSSVSVVGI